MPAPEALADPLVFGAATALALAGALGAAALRPQWVVAHPRAVLAALALVSLGAAAALVRLDPPGFRIDVDSASEPLLLRHDPARAVYERAVLDFGNDDLYVIAMETDDVFTHANLETLRRLTDALRTLPSVAAVESLTRALSIAYEPERELVGVRPFIDDVPAEPEALAELRKRALDDPLYRKSLVSEDGRAAAINVTFQPMTDAEFVERDLDGRIAALLERESGDGRRFYVAGRPHVRARAYHLMVRDIARLVPVAVAVAAVVLWAMWGSLRGVLVPLAACLTATLWVFGAMAAVGIDINLVTLVLASMMICIGSVYGVHVNARYELLAGDPSRDARDARDARETALACLRYARTPVLLAGLTTCIGFAALLLADIQAADELACFSILGVASVTLISLTGVPASFVLWPLGAGARRHWRAGDRVARGLERALRALAGVALGRPTAVIGVWAVLAAGALLAIPRIVIDTDVITFFLEDSRVRTDFAAVNRLLAGTVPVYVLVSSDREGAFREPETLRALAALAERLERVPGVSRVLSSVDLVRMSSRAMHDGGARHGDLPETRPELAEATFVIPKARLRRFQNADHSRANLVVRTGESGSAAIRALEARIRAVLAEADLPEGFTTGVTGNAVVLNRSADGIANSQATQVGFAAAAIFVLISAVFGSLRLGALAMVPNVVPVLIFFGILGAGVAPLSLPTSLIGSIALGIAIDDTMHFLVAYRGQRAYGLAPEEAARRCVLQVGRPIAMTSVMLVAGFLVMLLSGFATLREFGYLNALTMAICVCTDLLLLPALLVRFRA